MEKKSIYEIIDDIGFEKLWELGLKEQEEREKEKKQKELKGKKTTNS